MNNVESSPERDAQPTEVVGVIKKTRRSEKYAHEIEKDSVLSTMNILYRIWF